MNAVLANTQARVRAHAYTPLTNRATINARSSSKMLTVDDRSRDDIRDNDNRVV